MSEPAPAATGTPLADGDSSAGRLGLRPPPAPDPAVVAVVAAAFDQLTRRHPTPPPARPDPGPAWRFSGRWWSRPTVARRDRPWASR